MLSPINIGKNKALTKRWQTILAYLSETRYVQANELSMQAHSAQYLSLQRKEARLQHLATFRTINSH